MKKLILALIALAFVGCASQPPSQAHQSVTSTIENSLSYIRIASNLACTAVINLKVSDEDAVTKAKYISGISQSLYSLCNGNTPTVQQVKNVISIWTPSNAHWGDLSTSLGSIYLAFYPKIQGDSKTAFDVLGAMAAGALDASTPYLQ